MSTNNNTFSGSRFMRLVKQHLIHNSRLIIYTSVGYCGAVYFILFLLQLGNEGKQLDTEGFLGAMVGIVSVLGILYVGYSFPAFRSKERSFSYLMMPASSLEKFTFEFLSRVIVMLIALPILFWIVFNIQGYVFDMISSKTIGFNPIGLSDLRRLDFPQQLNRFWFKVLAVFGTFLVFVLPFTGSAMFNKQPLVKTLFAVAIIFIFYLGTTYIVVEPLGLSKYNANDSMWLIPGSEGAAMRFFGAFMVIANLVMLGVAYLKLKEKEV